VPDHVTIARFRAAFPDLAQELFTQVLMLCARLGMGQAGTVALDGTKITANAAKAANRTEERLRALAAQRAGEHAAADAAEDQRFGEGRQRGPPAARRRWRRQPGRGGSAGPWRNWKPNVRPRRPNRDAQARA